MKYRKKPITIEAVQIAKGMEKPDWLVAAIASGDTWERQYEDGTTMIVVKTPEGEMTATDGDWIIRGIKGELYPCKDDIFKATYDVTIESKFQSIDWTEISNRGLLRRINREIMHPLGLAVYRDPNTGVSGAALIAPDGQWTYEGETRDEPDAYIHNDQAYLEGSADMTDDIRASGTPMWTRPRTCQAAVHETLRGDPDTILRDAFDFLNVAPQLRTRSVLMANLTAMRQKQPDDDTIAAIRDAAPSFISADTAKRIWEVVVHPHKRNAPPEQWYGARLADQSVEKRAAYNAGLDKAIAELTHRQTLLRNQNVVLNTAEADGIYTICIDAIRELKDQ